MLKDITAYDHFLLIGEAEEVIGWTVAFLKEQEIWFSILVSPLHQNKGYGKMLINSLKQNFNELCGWVIDHDRDLKRDRTRYLTPLPFYLKNDFEVLTERIETTIIQQLK